MIDGQMLDQTITIILSIGLIVSAFLAIQLDEAMYSVVSLGFTLILLAIMYWIYDAIFAAIFQLVAGGSTLAILLLAGEMLTERTKKRDSRRHVLKALAIAAVISLPTVFITVSILPPVTPASSFPADIWGLRSVDIVLQGIVILVIAIGLAVILTQRKSEIQKQVGGVVPPSQAGEA